MIDPDNISRVIMLLYGRMENGGPFWCYVAVKPSRFDAFKMAERAGDINLYEFEEYGEVIVSAEGDQPPSDVTEKVADMYGADASTFFQPIDPLAEIATKISNMSGDFQGESVDETPAPVEGLPEFGWTARIGRRR